MWRNPRWKLDKGLYLVRVQLFSSGEKREQIFRLVNDVPQSDMRLEQPLPTDTVRD
jgi:hypothetical protein